MLCVQAQLLPTGSTLQPGGTAIYGIWVWSTVAITDGAMTAAITGQDVGTPAFTTCPAAQLTTCTIGTMPAMHAFYLVIKAPLGAAATIGQQVTLTLTIQGGGLSPGVASIGFLVGQSTLAPVPSPAGAGTSLSPIAFPAIGATTVAPSDLSGLFPVITPNAAQASGITAKSGQKVIEATTVSSTFPLDPRLIGSQLAGLAVLAAALTMVLLRLSLRTPVPVLRGGAIPSGALRNGPGQAKAVATAEMAAPSIAAGTTAASGTPAAAGSAGSAAEPIGAAETIPGGEAASLDWTKGLGDPAEGGPD